MAWVLAALLSTSLSLSHDNYYHLFIYLYFFFTFCRLGDAAFFLALEADDVDLDLVASDHLCSLV